MSQQRFLPTHRLRNAYEFNRVFQGNEYRVHRHEFLLLARNNSLGQNRLGLVVGKKITPFSVDRNNIKRLIRESFRTALPKFLGIDLVIVTRKGIRSKTKPEIRLILSTLWQKLEREIKAKQGD